MLEESAKLEEKEADFRLRVTDDDAIDASQGLGTQDLSGETDRTRLSNEDTERSHFAEDVRGSMERSNSSLSSVSSAGITSDMQSASLDIDLADHLEVLEEIGRGGTGQVYKVFDKNLQRVLAIKVLRKELLVDNQTVKRFVHEAEAAADLSHAHVVSVYGHGETKDGSPYITMNFIEGSSFSNLLKLEHEIEWQRALGLFIQICDGLEYAHQKGLIHRDLKPSNIIISSEDGGIEIAHIVDFGIAKVVTTRGDTYNTLTASGDFLGTPLYMSPEQCLGQNVDLRTDIYAIGCMLFEAINGSSPYASASPVEIIAKKMSEEAPTLNKENIPADLSLIASCCMARNANDRYSNVAELRQDLQSVLAGRTPRHARRKVGTLKEIAGKRLLAFVIDNTILSFISGAGNIFFVIIGMLIAAAPKASASAADGLGALALLSYFVFPLAASFTYFAWFEVRRGGTPGKRLCGLTVCDRYGKPLTYPAAIMRNFWKNVMLWVFPYIGVVGFILPEHGLGFLTSLFSFGLFMFIFLRSLIVHHRFPWDRAVGAQVKRR